jgi:hypothetical protein
VTGPEPATGPERYYAAVMDLDARLEATLAAIRASQDQGHLTTQGAAEARIEALEAHLAGVQRLRLEHLGAADPGAGFIS